MNINEKIQIKGVSFKQLFCKYPIIGLSSVICSFIVLGTLYTPYAIVSTMDEPTIATAQFIALVIGGLTVVVESNIYGRQCGTIVMICTLITLCIAGQPADINSWRVLACAPVISVILFVYAPACRNVVVRVSLVVSGLLWIVLCYY